MVNQIWVALTKFNGKKFPKWWEKFGKNKIPKIKPFPNLGPGIRKGKTT